MKKRSLLISGIVTVLMAVVVVGIVVITLKQTENEMKRESSEKVESYVQEVDENGIAIDMRDNPYFSEKLSGYDYPTAKTITYYSGVTKTYRHANVILPLDYDEDEKYPVLYLLHGLGGSHNTWLNKDADVIIQNLIYFNNVKPMIIVLPNSELNEEENLDDYDIWDKALFYDLTGEDLMGYLKPYIEENFSVKTGRQNTAIAGNSMGGRNAMNIAFHYADSFGYVGLFSPASVMDKEGYNTFNAIVDDSDLTDKDFKMLMLMVGNEDDVCGWVSYDLHDRFYEHQIPHIFYEVEGGHNTYVWQNALYNFVQRIF